MLGYGPIPAPVARELALGSPGSAARRSIRRLFLAPSGSQLVDIDSRRREFTANQRRFIRLRDQDTCRTPWCNAPIRHIDHVEDWARSKRTRVAAAQGYCAACNFTKQAPGWQTRIGPDGATITFLRRGRTTLTLTYQRERADGSYRDVRGASITVRVASRGTAGRP